MSQTVPKFQFADATPTCLVLTCTGGLSWEDRGFLPESVEQYLQARAEVACVVLDLRGLTFVNSAGLGALFQLAALLRRRQTRLMFAHVPPLVLRMFMAVGLDRLVGVADSVPEALLAAARPATPDITLDSTFN
jgi:anti-anti-sigma factor